MRIRTCVWFFACIAGAAGMIGCEPAEELPPSPNAPTADAQPAAPPTQTAAATTPPKAVSQAQSPMAPALAAQTPLAPGQQTPIAPGQQMVKPAPAFDANLIPNGSFEYLRDDGTPGGWALTEGLVTAADGPAQHGDHALTLTSTEGEYGVLSHSTPVAAADLGKKLRVTAWAVSDSHWKLTMDVQALQGGETVLLDRKGWTEAADAWAPLELSVELPDDIDPESVRVRFVVANEPGLTFKLDNVRAEIALLGNASFEAKDDDGRPLGWAVSPLASIKTVDDPAPYDGGELLALESTADSWTVVIQPLDIRPGDIGREIVVAARAIAPAPDALAIAIECEIDGKPQSLGRATWPASADWAQMTASAILPENADPESVEVRLGVRDQEGMTVFIDDVQAQVR